MSINIFLRNEVGASEISRLQGELIEAKTHITRQDSLIRSFKEVRVN